MRDLRELRHGQGAETQAAAGKKVAPRLAQHEVRRQERCAHMELSVSESSIAHE
jgi:hypothetical protein